MLTHLDNLGNDGIGGPLDAEHFSELFQVMCSGLTNGKDCVAKPVHAEVAELLVEEVDTQLAGKKGNVLDNGEANSPLLVLGKLHDGREKRL